jgi:son of sevenless-like protein
MTLIEEELFRNVRPRELIGLAWTKKDKEKRAPNLLKISARFNAVSDWVKSSIVQEKDLKKRTKIFEKFVEIAVELGKLNNYNACMEITSALESASIFRLKKTKAKVSAKLLAKYDELHASLSRQQNYKALREAIHASNPPVIPYFGMYQSDLTFIEEGNPDMLKDTDPPLINFHKRRLVAQVLVDEVQQYQQAPYNLQKVPVLREKLEQALVENILDDNACYAESLVAEPRE